MDNIKLGHRKEKIFEKNETIQNLGVDYKSNHVLSCLYTHDGIKELNFMTKTNGRAVGLVLSYLSTHMFYSLLMKN